MDCFPPIKVGLFLMGGHLNIIGLKLIILYYMWSSPIPMPKIKTKENRDKYSMDSKIIWNRKNNKHI